MQCSGRGTNAMVGVALCTLLCNIATTVADPVTFTGDGYARYTLLDGGVAKRQVNMEMAFYEESISMRVRTIAEEGLLFQMGGANDLAVLEVCELLLKSHNLRCHTF